MMRNDDRTTDSQADGEALEDLWSSHALLGAVGENVRHAVVRSENQRSDEAQELGLDVERAGLASAGIERKEPVDDGIPFIDTLDVQTRAELDEVLERSIMLARNVIAVLYGR